MGEHRCGRGGGRVRCSLPAEIARPEWRRRKRQAHIFIWDKFAYILRVRLKSTSNDTKKKQIIRCRGWWIVLTTQPKKRPRGQARVVAGRVRSCRRKFGATNLVELVLRTQMDDRGRTELTSSQPSCRFPCCLVLVLLRATQAVAM